jgi:hypothetical protein
MNDWADVRAREWIDARGGLVVSDEYCIESLAALLREASEAEAGRWTETEGLRNENVIFVARERLLAEVRRVVEEVKSNWSIHSVVPTACLDILARLEKL